MILTALDWVLTLVLLALAASSGWHLARDRSRSCAVAAGMYAGVACVMLAIVGVLAWGTAAVLAVLFLGASAGLVLSGGRKGAARAALGHASDGVAGLAGDAGGLWHRFRGSRGGAPEPAPGSPQEVVAEAAAARGIPPVMEDPALGLAPEPAELAGGTIPAPAPYAALAEFIAGFEPEDDLALRMFMESSAAGSVLVADAWHHFADTCLNGAGLDPAFVAGVMEAGDSSGAHGTLLAQVSKRFTVIYHAVQEWVGAHGPLPHKAREFLTGDL